MPKRKASKEKESEETCTQIIVSERITSLKATPSSNGGKITDYKNFKIDGKNYTLGSCVYLQNLENSDKPDMMKIVRISVVEHKKASLSVEVTGRWLYGPHFQQNKLLIKEKFAMDDHEVLFSVEESEMDVDLILGSFRVISKEEFQNSSSELKPSKRKPRILKLQDVLQREVYYCSRAWIPRAQVLVNSFTWSDYETNSKDFVQSRPKRSSATSGRFGSNSVKSTLPNGGTRSTNSTPGTKASQRGAAVTSGGVGSASKVDRHSHKQNPRKGVKNTSRRSVGGVHKKSTPRKQVSTPSARSRRHSMHGTKSELITEEIVQLKSGRSSRKRENAYKDEHEDQSDDESFESSNADHEESDEGEFSMNESQESESQVSNSETDVDDNDEIENIIEVKKRPRAFKQRKRALMKSAKRHENYAIHERKTRLLKAGNDLEEATDRLHVSAVPDALPGREEEFCELYGLLETAIEEGSGMCIYVHGVPGTGKTATVKAVLRNLQKAVKQEELADFEFIEINGMRLSEPAQAYSTLWNGLTGERVSPAHAEDLLDARFRRHSADRVPCVVLMDELDLLVTKKQSVVYNFFEWPNLKNSQLIVVAVANTMDLPERSLSNKVASRLGLTRKVFQPYTYEQLIKIVQSRLEGLKCYTDRGVIYLARSIAASSGDARRCLDVCRRAVEIFVNSDDSQTGVDMDHVKQAIQEMTKSSLIPQIQRCSFQQLLFLLSCVKRSRATGIKELTFCDIVDDHYAFCFKYLSEKYTPSVSTLHEIANFLSGFNLLIAERSKAGEPGQKIQMRVHEDDIFQAIKSISHPKLMPILKQLDPSA